MRDEVVLAPVRNGDDGAWTVDDWTMDWTATGAGESEAGYETRASALLEARTHATETAYDALGRPRWSDLPADADGQVRRLVPTYGRSGAMTGVRSRLGGAEDTVVERIAHDARGQRLLLALGNGTMTRYAYEPSTRRLARIRTEAFRRGAGTPDTEASGGAPPDLSLSYVPDGRVVQDEGYRYDLAGNVTAIRERTAGAGIAGTPLGRDALDRQFAYDALDRLVRATGREADRPLPSPVWADPVPYGASVPDPTAMRSYERTYAFDAVGNVLRMRHTALSGRTETATVRAFALDGATNRMATLTVGQTVVPYAYDAAGRTVREAADRHMAWGADGKLRSFRTQTGVGQPGASEPGAAEPSVYARYLYDAGGARIKKVVRRQGGQGHSVTEVGPVSWTRAWDASGTTVREATTTAFSDTTGRIAEINAGPAETGDNRPPVRFVVSDRLGNAVTTLGGQSVTEARTRISAEGYFPYGETAWGSAAKKRYRYNGKERDEESGLYNYGARYYAAHTLRFVSVDPLWRQYPEYAPYAYAGNRPVSMVDIDGRQPGTPNRQYDGSTDVGEYGTVYIQPSPRSKQIGSHVGESASNGWWNGDTSHTPLALPEVTVRPKPDQGLDRPDDSTLDAIQLGLDAAGFLPVVGTAADIGSAALSLYRGDYVGFGFGMAAAIPLFGDAIAAARLGRRAAHVADAAETGVGLAASARRAEIEYLYRGTTPGFPGGQPHTFTSTSPGVAAHYASEAAVRGRTQGVIHIVPRDLVRGVESPGLLSVDKELLVDMLPLDFENLSVLSVPFEQAQSALSSLGHNVPSRINGYDDLNSSLHRLAETPMSLLEIRLFNIKVGL